MDFKSFIDSLFLNEVTAEEKYTKQYHNKLDRELFDKAVAIDPTSKGDSKVGKYVDWIIKNKAYDLKDTEELTTYLTNFDKFKDKIEPSKRDINKLNLDSLKELIDIVSQEGGLVSKKDKANAIRKKAESESEMVLNTDNYIIISPETEFASQYFGANSDWCTARQDHGNCMFNRYNKEGKLYIIKNKHKDQKWQIYVPNHGDNYEMKDSNNDDFDPYSTFENDDKLVNWLEEQGIKNKKLLTDEDVDSLARRFLSNIDYEDTENYDDALEIVKNYYSQYQGMEFEYDVENMFDFLIIDMSDTTYNFEEALKYLGNKYGFDSNEDHNKYILLPYLVSDLFYDVKNNNIDGLDELDWKLEFDESVNNLLKKISNRNDYRTYSFTELDLDYFKKYLEYNYEKDYKKFESFYDEFVNSWDDHFAQELTDENKQELKELIDKVEKIMYSKQDHPKLDLQSFYWDKVNFFLTE